MTFNSFITRKELFPDDHTPLVVIISTWWHRSFLLEHTPSDFVPPSLVSSLCSIRWRHRCRCIRWRHRCRCIRWCHRCRYVCSCFFFLWWVNEVSHKKSDVAWVRCLVWNLRHKCLRNVNTERPYWRIPSAVTASTWVTRWIRAYRSSGFKECSWYMYRVAHNTLYL